VAFVKKNIALKLENMLRGMWHVRGRGEVHTGFWWGNLNEKDNLEDPGIDGRIILRRILIKSVVMAWNGLIWLWIGKKDELFL
jgi:hypothetical protein